MKTNEHVIKIKAYIDAENKNKQQASIVKMEWPRWGRIEELW